MNQYVYLHEDTLFHIFSDISLDITFIVVFIKQKNTKKISWMISYKSNSKYYNAIKLFLVTNIQTIKPLELMTIYFKITRNS